MVCDSFTHVFQSNHVLCCMRLIVPWTRSKHYKGRGELTPKDNLGIFSVGFMRKTFCFRRNFLYFLCTDRPAGYRPQAVGRLLIVDFWKFSSSLLILTYCQMTVVAPMGGTVFDLYCVMGVVLKLISYHQIYIWLKWRGHRHNCWASCIAAK